MNSCIYTLQNNMLSYPGSYSSVEDIIKNSLGSFSSFELSCCAFLSGWVAIRKEKSEAGIYMEQGREPLTLHYDENDRPYFTNK